MLPVQPDQNYSKALEELGFIYHEGRYWLSQIELGRRLGFSHPTEAMAMLFARSKDELQPFTCHNKMLWKGQMRKMRFYDLQGCYIAAFLAKTKEAKHFRRQVADLLVNLQVITESVLRMQEEFHQMKQEMARLKFQTFLQRSRKFNKRKFQRLLQLQDFLTKKELARVFGVSQRHITYALNLYYEAGGGLLPQKKK